MGTSETARTRRYTPDIPAHEVEPCFDVFERIFLAQFLIESSARSLIAHRSEVGGRGWDSWQIELEGKRIVCIPTRSKGRAAGCSGAVDTTLAFMCVR
jgi:hypothetical protein